MDLGGKQNQYTNPDAPGLAGYPRRPGHVFCRVTKFRGVGRDAHALADFYRSRFQPSLRDPLRNLLGRTWRSLANVFLSEAVFPICAFAPSVEHVPNRAFSTPP